MCNREKNDLIRTYMYLSKEIKKMNFTLKKIFELSYGKLVLFGCISYFVLSFVFSNDIASRNNSQQ